MHMVLKYLERSKEVITARLIESQGLVRVFTPPPVMRFVMTTAERLHDDLQTSKVELSPKRALNSRFLC